MSDWYWVIDCDNTVENPLVIDSGDLGMNPEEISHGKRLRDWSDRAWLGVRKPENDGMPDDVLQNYLDLPIYSKRLRAALDAAGIKGVQYLPVRIVTSSGQELPGFCVVNIVERRRALDFVRSDYEVFPDDYFLKERVGQVRAIRRAALKQDMLEGCDIVRLDEYPISVYVSSRFKQVFESGMFTGYSFRKTITR